MIKQRKIKCWVIYCDKCGGEIEGSDENTLHYDTKKEAERFAKEILRDLGGNQILCYNCGSETEKKK